MASEINDVKQAAAAYAEKASGGANQCCPPEALSAAFLAGFTYAMSSPEVQALAEALKFYADVMNWDYPVTGTEENNMLAVDDLYVPDGLCDPRSGKRASVALSRFAKQPGCSGG